MPDEQIPTLPTYRYRGSVRPSAAIARPAVCRLNAAKESDGGSSSTSATLDLFDVIDSWGGWWGISAREVDAALKAVGDVDTLYVRVNSPGGEATEGVAIANLLRAHKADVRITVYGLAASAASYISTAGDVVAMAPGTMMMVHSAWNIILGNAEDLRDEAAVLDKHDESIASLYVLKAGGTVAEWLDTMHAETWYTAADAVKAKLADVVGIDPQLPADAGQVPDAVDAEKDAEPDGDVFDLATRRFDLSVFTHAPAAQARTQAPAEPPVVPSTTPKEADTMSDTLKQGLRERFDFPEDADDSAILAAVDSARDPEVTNEAIAKANGLTAEQVKGALDAAKAGKVSVSQSFLDTLEANAKLGAEARSKQLNDERDEAIQAKVSAGIISRDQVESWQRDWDRDPASAKAELDKLTVARFPVGPTQGIPGDDGGTGTSAAFSDDEAAALGQLAGVSKEGLMA